jgi:hypothetical protein
VSVVIGGLTQVGFVSVNRAIVQGAIRFAVVSVAAFLVWALGGRWFYARGGEAGLYAAVALVFIALSALLLHPLLERRGSLRRFYTLFVPAFVAYAAVWCAFWFAFRFGWGEWLGSLGGSVVFCAVVGAALRNLRPLLAASAVLFVTHSAGYFAGGWAMHELTGAARFGSGSSGAAVALLAKLVWGLLYGLGFGAGLGYAFFAFQRRPDDLEP